MRVTGKIPATHVMRRDSDRQLAIKQGKGDSDRWFVVERRGGSWEYLEEVGEFPSAAQANNYIRNL